MEKTLTIIITTLTTLSVIIFIGIISFHTNYYYYSYNFKNGSGGAFQENKYFDFNLAKKQVFNEVGDISIINFQEVTKEEYMSSFY